MNTFDKICGTISLLGGTVAILSICMIGINPSNEEIYGNLALLGLLISTLSFIVFAVVDIWN